MDNQRRKNKAADLVENRQTVLEDTQNNTLTISRKDLKPADEKTKAVIVKCEE